MRSFECFGHNDDVRFASWRLINPIRLKQAIRQSITGEFDFIAKIHQHQDVEEVVDRKDSVNYIR